MKKKLTGIVLIMAGILLGIAVSCSIWNRKDFSAGRDNPEVWKEDTEPAAKGNVKGKETGELLTKETEEGQIGGADPINAEGDEEAALQAEGMQEARTLINEAKDVLGLPYHIFGTDPETGFTDISFVVWCLKQAQIADYPVATYELLYSRCPDIRTDSMFPGDIIFFQTGGEISHVGIYTGGNCMIHCAETVEEISIGEGSIWENKIAAAGRFWTYRAFYGKEDDPYEEKN